MWADTSREGARSSAGPNAAGRRLRAAWTAGSYFAGSLPEVPAMLRR